MTARIATARRVGREARSRGTRLERIVAQYLHLWRARGLELWLVGAHTYPVGRGLGRYSGLTPDSRMVDLVGRYYSMPVALDIKGTSAPEWRMTARTLPESERDCLKRFDGAARYAFAGLLICTNEDTQPRWELRRLLCGVQSGLYEDPEKPRRVAVDLPNLPDGFSELVFGGRAHGGVRDGSGLRSAAARTKAEGLLRGPVPDATVPDGDGPGMWGAVAQGAGRVVARRPHSRPAVAP